MREVLITQRAQDELDSARDWWAAHRSVDQADRWYVGFVQAMLTLESSAEQHPLAPESELFPYEVRQLDYGLSRKPTHRALYTLRPDKIIVLRVRHLAQQPLSVTDV